MTVALPEIDHRQYSWEDLANEEEWRRCFPVEGSTPAQMAEGFRHFCANHWTIQRHDGGRVPFELYDAQYESVLSWLSDRYSITLKARQIGFTTLLAAYAFWCAFGYHDRPVLLLSRNLRYAVKLLAKAKFGMTSMPKWMKTRGPPITITQTKMEFANGSYVESLPSASDPARGESAWLVAVDEFAYIPNQDEAWAAIEPVADAGGRVVLLSTAQGEGDTFHSLWVAAEAGRNRFEPLFHPWWSNGRDQEWYERQCADLPDWQVAQEYPDNPEDAFLRSGRPVFDPVMIRRRQTEIRDPIWIGRILDDIDGHKVFAEDGDGELRIWEHPSRGGRYAIGADAAQGLEHGDFSSMHVVDVKTGAVVAHWHGKIDADLFGTQVLKPIGEHYNQALVGVESNTHGLTTLKALERTRYWPIYTERNSRYKSGGKRAKPTEQLGFRTSQVSKPLIIDGLAEALRDDDMQLWCAHTFAEIRSYVYTGTSTTKMEGSPHDDRTMSLAIAYHMTKFVFLDKYKVDDRPEPGSVEDWQKRLYGNTLAELKKGRAKRQGVARKGDLIDRPPIGYYNVRAGAR